MSGTASGTVFLEVAPSRPSARRRRRPVEQNPPKRANPAGRAVPVLGERSPAPTPVREGDPGQFISEEANKGARLYTHGNSDERPDRRCPRGARPARGLYFSGRLRHPYRGRPFRPGGSCGADRVGVSLDRPATRLGRGAPVVVPRSDSRRRKPRFDPGGSDEQLGVRRFGVRRQRQRHRPYHEPRSRHHRRRFRAVSSGDRPRYDQLDRVRRQLRLAERKRDLHRRGVRDRLDPGRRRAGRRGGQFVQSRRLCRERWRWDREHHLARDHDPPRDRDRPGGGGSRRPCREHREPRRLCRRRGDRQPERHLLRDQHGREDPGSGHGARSVRRRCSTTRPTTTSTSRTSARTT